jgi:hypothetical protein
MLYRFLADLILVLHLGFIVFVVAGGLLALRWRWMPLVHLPAVAWGVFVELAGKVCPLTPFENVLRQSAGASGYEGGFVEHYLIPLIYPGAPSPHLAIILAALVVVANVIVYSVVWRYHRKSSGVEMPR